MGSAVLAASVLRRSASCPRMSSPGASGALVGHHMTTGESGSSMGSTTESACSRTSPDSRSTMTSPGTSSARWMSASSRSVLPVVLTTSTRRQGCSRAAVCAAAYAFPNERCSAGTTSVSTRPEALPRRLRALSSALAISLVSVCVSVMIMGLLGPSPGVAVARDHLVGAGRAPRPGLVVLRWCLEARPVVEHRIEDLPAELDLLLLREQWRVTEQYVQKQPLVRLGRRLGERVAVAEVHVDVPDLHLATGDLGAEPQRHAFVGLDPHHERIPAQVEGVGLHERQVRRFPELERDLRDTPGETLASAEVERDASPPTAVDVDPEGCE